MTALLQVRGLTKKYLGLTAVDDVSYEVEAGTIVGLIGPNGSGKSTSIDCISGFQPANGGRWSLGGADLTGLPPHKIARAGLTRSFQTVRAYDELTLLENLCVVPSGNQDAIDVAIEQPRRQWRCAVDLRQAQVTTHSQLPSLTDRLCGRAKEPPRQIVATARQAVPQHQCFQGGHRHTLGVDRVEAAHRVADHQ